MTDADLMTALAVHAPAVPEWFMRGKDRESRPQGGLDSEWTAWIDTRERKRTALWPWAYAEMVMAARPAAAAEKALAAAKVTP